MEITEEQYERIKDALPVQRGECALEQLPPLLLVLWREQHPEGHEQTYIDFNVRKPPAQSVPLNFEPVQKD